MNLDDAAFRQLIEKHLSQTKMTAKDFAASVGVSPAYMSAVTTGKKPPSKKILQALGYERIVHVEYKPIRKCL